MLETIPDPLALLEDDFEDDPAEIVTRLGQSDFAFVSGLSRSNRDIEATIAARLPIGVSAHAALTEPVRRRIVDYVNDGGGRLFVDSGAFTCFTKGHATDWPIIAARYREIFHRIRRNRRHHLCFTAPDVVGDPEATIELQSELFFDFRWIMLEGGNLIVPHQRPADGSITPGNIDDCWPRCEYPHRWILGIPFNAAAYSEDEVLAWMASNHVEDVRIHLLGGGPTKVRSLIDRARAAGLRFGTLTGDSFHGPARDRKFEKRDQARRFSSHAPTTPC